MATGNTEQSKRNLANGPDFRASGGSLGGVSRIPGAPYHLAWLNHMSAKIGLTGDYYNINNYCWDGQFEAAMAQVPIYVIDTGFEYSHLDIGNVGLRNNNLGFNCTNSASLTLCDQIDTSTNDLHDLSDLIWSHSTEMVGLIGGNFGGVNPFATITLLALRKDSMTIELTRALGTVIELQRRNGDQRAIINFSRSSETTSEMNE